MTMARTAQSVVKHMTGVRFTSSAGRQLVTFHKTIRTALLCKKISPLYGQTSWEKLSLQPANLPVTGSVPNIIYF